MNHWTPIRLWTLLLAGGLLAPLARAAAVDWQLDVEFYDPQRITLPTPSGSATYWYVLFEVNNRTGRDVQFYPSFRLVTDTLQVIEAGDQVSLRVYDAIADRHRDEYPFFVPPHRASGLLLQGRQNARASAAVFRVFDPEAASFTVYMSGFSGKLDRVPNPVFNKNRDESQDNPRFFLLRRTLAIRYDLPGDPVTRQASVPVRRNREWVMR